MTPLKATAIGVVAWALIVGYVALVVPALEPAHRSTHSTQCPPPAHIGCSLPHQQLTRTTPRTGVAAFPDISEYQGCPRFFGPVIFKVYEGGYGKDHSALCNAQRVHRLHTWAGVYAFLRPAYCSAQGVAVANLVRSLGGVPGPVVADAEVALPSKCVSQFLSAVRTHLGGPVDIYTSQGTWPGGSLTAPLWDAAYGPRPGCVAGVCSHVAWQFTDNGVCGGLIHTDCSLPTGILRQVRQPPKPPTPPKPPAPKPTPAQQRIAFLRSLARKHNCYRPGSKPWACHVWGQEVRTLEHRK